MSKTKLKDINKTNEEKGFLCDFPEIPKLITKGDNSKIKIEIYKLLENFADYHGYKLNSEEFIKDDKSLTWIRKSDNYKFRRSVKNLKILGWPSVKLNSKFFENVFPNIDLNKHSTKQERAQVIIKLKEFGKKYGYVLKSKTYVGINKSLLWVRDFDKMEVKVNTACLKKNGWTTETVESIFHDFPNIDMLSYTSDKNRKIVLEKLKYFAKKYEYELVSEIYVSPRKLLHWKKDKIIFAMSATDLRINGWPSIQNLLKELRIHDQENMYFNKTEFPTIFSQHIVNRKELITDEFRKFGEKYGFRLISAFVSANRILDWIRLSDNAKFSTKIDSLRSSGWPSERSIKIMDYDRKTNQERINLLNKFIIPRAGKLITKKIKSSSTIIKIKLKNGDIYKTTPYHVMQGMWKQNYSLTTEPIIRQIFQHIFGGYFQNNWDIIKKDKTHLELDGYEEINYNGIPIKLAFEYQGSLYHYEDLQVIKRDEYKKDFCKNNGIHLIVIDQIKYRKRFERYCMFDIIHEYIKNYFFTEFGFVVDFSNKRETFKIDVSKIDICIEKYEYWKALGLKNGFKLLSTEYIDSDNKLKWKSISEEFEFEMVPNRFLKNGKWPTKIETYLKTEKYLWEDLKKLVINRGGNLLTKKYISRTMLITIETKISGKVFTMALNEILKGHWSPYEIKNNRKSKLDKILPNGDLQITCKNGEVITYRDDPDNPKLKIFIDIKFVN